MNEHLKNVSWLRLTIIFLVAFITISAGPQETADLILTGAKIWTADAKNPWAD
jgi:hypothetical protein